MALRKMLFLCSTLSAIFCHGTVSFLSTDPIQFTVQPQDLYLTLRDGVRPHGSLHCVAKCVDPEHYPITYTWLYNGEELRGNTSIRKIYQNGTIWIAKISRRVVGSYQCGVMAARGSFGLLAAPVDVKEVVFKDGFVIAPKSRHVLRSRPAVFQCQPLRMAPPAIIKWQFNGKPIETSSTHQILSSGDLLIPSVNEDLVGKYKCLAENPVSQEFAKSGAQLMIEEDLSSFLKPRRMSLKSQNLTVSVGDDVAIDCITHAAKVPDSIEWKHNGAVLLEEEKDVAHRFILNLGLVEVEQEGLYECLVRFGEKGFKVTAVSLTVQDPPSVTLTPSSTQLNATHPNASLTCKSSGHPTPTTRLYHNTKLVATSNQQQNTLTANVSEIGMYQCVAESSAGWASWTSFVAGSPPVFQSGKKVSLSVMGAMALELTCDMFGIPEPVVTYWKRKEVLGGKWRSLTASVGTVRVDGASLVVESVGKGDGGLYMCVAENVHGKEKKIWNVTVAAQSPGITSPSSMPSLTDMPALTSTNTKPDAQSPRVTSPSSMPALTSTNTKPDAQSLRVTSPSSMSSLTDMPSLTSTNTKPDAQSPHVTSSSSMPALTSTNTKPDAQFPRITSPSSMSPLMDMPVLTSTTTKQDPTFEIHPPVMQSATTVRLHWLMNGHYDNVRCFVNVSDGRQWNVDLLKSRDYVEVTGLVPLTRYHITVTVTVGIYVLKDSVSFNTPDSKPSLQPTITRISVVSPYTIRVNWSQPSLPPHQPVTGYIIKYQQEGTDAMTVQTVTGQTFLTIKRLQPNTMYQIWVMPYNKYGDGVTSEMRMFTTLQESPPQSPNDGSSSSSVSLGVIMGIVGGLLGLILIVALVFLVVRSRKDDTAKQRAQLEAVAAKWEEARENGKPLYNSEPEGPTPTLSSTRSSPTLEKKPIDALQVIMSAPDFPDDEEDFVPGYASIAEQNGRSQQEESTLSRQPSNAGSHLSIQHDDGIPDYATVNEKTKKKYRSRASLVKLNINMESLDKDIEVLDYAELEMMPGGPLPVVEPEDRVDYAEIDFTQTL